MIYFSFSKFIKSIFRCHYVPKYICKKVVFKHLDLCIFSLLGCLFTYNILFSNIQFIISFRFYFGFIFFYIIFKNFKFYNFNRIFIFVTIGIWIEFLLINTVINPNYYQIIQISVQPLHGNNVIFRRPYSFGCNASVSSSLFVVIFYLTSVNFKNIYTHFLFIITTSLFMSEQVYLYIIIFICDFISISFFYFLLFHSFITCL